MLSLSGENDAEKFRGAIFSKTGNWGRIKGGKAVQEKYSKENRFEEIHRGMRKASSEYMKKWHSKMKRCSPNKYYALQHSRFKRVGGYKFISDKGHHVRNKFELEIANILNSIPVNYEYEPMIRISSTYLFPDFKIKNLIIECTYWRGAQKAQALSEKIKKYEEAGFEVKVVIPEKLSSFYKSIEKHTISPDKVKSLF